MKINVDINAYVRHNQYMSLGYWIRKEYTESGRYAVIIVHEITEDIVYYTGVGNDGKQSKRSATTIIRDMGPNFYYVGESPSELEKLVYNIKDIT